MDRKKTGILAFGVILACLGLLWFLQGAGVLTLCPVLCFADCECITGGSLPWAVIGAVVCACGMVILARTLMPKK